MHVRLTIPAIGLLVLTTSLAGQEPERRRRDRAAAPPAELQHLTWRTESLRSEAVGQEVPYGIYLPKGYDDPANAEVKWPLVIWLHGMWEDHQRFHGRGGAPLLDQAVGSGTLPPCIFVTANGGRTSMYLNRKDQKWEDLVTVELPAHLAKKYRVSERREERALMGVSMGGMAALRIAFTRPELFGTVATHSAAIFAEDPEELPERIQGLANRLGLDEEFGNPIQKEPWQKANPLCIAATADRERLASLHVYFDAGTADRMGLHVGNQALHAKLEERRIPHEWRLIEGGGHSWGDGYQHAALPQSFAFVGKAFAAAKAATATANESRDGAGATPPAGKSGGKAESGGKH